MICLDSEIYSNFFLISFKQLKTGKIKHFEMYDGHPLDKVGVATIMAKHTTISFNGLNFDLPIIQAALEGFDNQRLKNLCDAIIKVKGGSWKVCRDNQIIVPGNWSHVDLFEVAPGRASLKIYGGRMHAPKMQDLPIEPAAEISPEQREIIKSYCENDLATTELLYNTLKPQIALRESMSKQYGIDLRSKSDAQIAETVIKSELHKITKKTYVKPKIKDGVTFKYQDPGIVSFGNPDLQRVFERILNHDFEVAGNGSIAMPSFLKDQKIKICDREYQMGIGGLHSCEKAQFIKRGEDELLIDADVASYYPSIILQQQLSPKSIGSEFLYLYRSLVTRRLKAKASGDKVTADTFKICLNGSFGKLGSKYSYLYAPELLLQTTVTGQLCLLMLIERMESAGIVIRSANTDGIVCHAPRTLERTFQKVAWDWMLDTSFNLERTDYKLLASRDVNNYLAVKTDGKMKGKGVFGGNGLMKNPDRRIIYKAVAEFLSKGIPIEDTIYGCEDMSQFVTVRAVTGGAKYNGEYLGKAVRFYSAVSDMALSLDDDCLYNSINGNKVPKSSGCRPLMDMNRDRIPEDLDYRTYIFDARKLLKEIGV